MPVRPPFLSKTPSRLDLESSAGDVLADVLGGTMLHSALYKRIEAHAPWGIAVRQKPRATFYVLARGSALLEVEGERPLSLSAGDVAFLPHGTAHVLRDAKSSATVPICDGPPRASSEPRRIGANGAQSSIVAGFFERDGERSPVLLQRVPNVVRISPSDADADPGLGLTLQLLLAESSASRPASGLVLHRLADILFVQALRTVARNAACPRGLPALADPSIHEALRLMHGDVKTQWTVAELAKHVGMSRSAFAARFVELVGEPPLQYLVRWRVARAAELLRDTEVSVTEIAARVGYESVPSFSKTFKRWRGSGPATFRRAARKAEVESRSAVAS
jgi:AraC-like DNA-binding protein